MGNAQENVIIIRSIFQTEIVFTMKMVNLNFLRYYSLLKTRQVSITCINTYKSIIATLVCRLEDPFTAQTLSRASPN